MPITRTHSALIEMSAHRRAPSTALEFLSVIHSVVITMWLRAILSCNERCAQRRGRSVGASRLGSKSWLAVMRLT